MKNQTHLLQTLQDPKVLAPLRRQAGLELGRIGWIPEDLDVLIQIPAGSFLCGEEKETCTIPYPYWIGKYPVTNLQFTRFIHNNSYTQRTLWSDAGWEWLITKGFTAPREFESPEWNNPIFPVIDISWFEAQAYCIWLNSQESVHPIPVGYVFRLATHEEWQRAARGTDGREYPWGNKFDPANANTKESRLAKTTPVCTYPQGVSADGVWDMSGNVFEWIAEYNVRGGCFDTSSWAARCAFRDWYNPGSYFLSYGFRVVLSLANISK